MAERIPFILGSIVYRFGPTPFHFLKLVWPGYACLGGLAIQVFIGILKYSNSEEKCFGFCLNDLRLKSDAEGPRPVSGITTTANTTVICAILLSQHNGGC